jgi:hypothetical protein
MAKKPVDPEAAAAIAPDKIKPQELATRLADPDFRARVEDAVASLPPEKAAELVALLEASIRRRKIELVGYLAAAVVLLLGMVIAIYAYGAAAEGRFVGWVFILPLALAGLVMIAVGRAARRAEEAERQKRAARAAPGV